MSTRVTRSSVPLLLLTLAAVLALQAAPAAAAVTSYETVLSGPAESPPNASPADGSAEVDIDPVAHTLHVRIVFSGLLGTSTASHIHAPTAVAFTGTAGVATTLPYFAGFPIGVTAGVYDNTLDTTQLSSFSSTFVTNNGGTAAGAESALFAAIAAGTAYVNVHSTVYTGGEIRGFLQPFDPTPTKSATWGRIKALYR